MSGWDDGAALDDEAAVGGGEVPPPTPVVDSTSAGDGDAKLKAMEAKLNAVGVKSLLSSLSPLLALVVVALIGRSFGLGEYLSLDTLRRDHVAIRQAASDYVVAFPAAFILLYALVVALSLPGATPLTVGAGLVFSQPLATALSVAGATAGACAAYALARRAMPPAVRVRVRAMINDSALGRSLRRASDALSALPALVGGRRGVRAAAATPRTKGAPFEVFNFSHLEGLARSSSEAVGRSGVLRGVAAAASTLFGRFTHGASPDSVLSLVLTLTLLRLTPVVPFWFVNVLPAVFDVPMPLFALATGVAIVPGSFLYTQAGAVLAATVDETAGRTGVSFSSLLVDALLRRELLAPVLLLLLWVAFIVSAKVVLESRRCDSGASGGAAAPLFAGLQPARSKKHE